MTLHRPTSLDAALALLADGGVVLAGGTDVYPALRDAAPPDRMIDVTGIAGLRGIARTDSGWRIGAATTWTDVLRADLPPLFDGLKLAASEVGAMQIQNTGTLAGNLCNASPAADGVPPLLALDTQVVLAREGRERRLPLGDFLQGPRQTACRPDELMTALEVPFAEDTGGFLKLGARRYLVISIAMIGVTVAAQQGRISRARIAVGACSPVARRLDTLEAALAGADARDVADIVAQADLSVLTPIDDVRAPATYRTDAVRTLVRRALLQAMEVSNVA
ncbi:FAD binding domain-containing protein [Thalassococcus sp. BH17M4-6]|uniref:FAD binding domain-containing protein n=1 Tax=Thalassococcus sp. BH17M4-6 TaxID=3413148 RepID=UPI003BC2B2D2